MEVLIPKIMFLLSNHDTTDVIYPEPQKNRVLSECRISGSKYHEEADTEAAPPPHNYPIIIIFFFQSSLVGFYSFIIGTIK